MKLIRSFAFAAVTALAAAACAQAPAAQPRMPMSMADQKAMSSCMTMSSEDMMKTPACTEMMTKMKVSAADMQTMMTCRKMDRDAMAKDQQCATMMKAHADMMKMPMQPH